MSTQPTGQPQASARKKGVRNTALICVGTVVAMIGAAYASVPLYYAFCRATGFGGTPIVGTEAASETLARRIEVRFDTNVAPGLDWSFAPETNKVEAQIGETKTVFFRVRNDGKAPATGVAAFNVQPDQAGAYFVKLQCFCFNEQTLAAGESMDFPVVFYVDPAIAKEPTLDGLSSITLSYTYFASKNPALTTPAAPGKTAAVDLKPAR